VEDIVISVAVILRGVVGQAIANVHVTRAQDDFDLLSTSVTFKYLDLHVARQPLVGRVRAIEAWSRSTRLALAKLAVALSQVGGHDCANLQLLLANGLDQRSQRLAQAASHFLSPGVARAIVM